MFIRNSRVLALFISSLCLSFTQDLPTTWQKKDGYLYSLYISKAPYMSSIVPKGAPPATVASQSMDSMTQLLRMILCMQERILQMHTQHQQAMQGALSQQLTVFPGPLRHSERKSDSLCSFNQTRSRPRIITWVRSNKLPALVNCEQPLLQRGIP